MLPEEFVSALDQWGTKGGELAELVRNHDITTTVEAEAVCRALGTSHILSANAGKRSTLFYLADLFQTVETKEAADILASRGLPLLRNLLRDALGHVLEPHASDHASREDDADYDFLLKILAMYRERGDGSLIVQAARDPRIATGSLWHVVLYYVDQGHPDADEIWESLREPLPESAAGIAYLDIANRFILERKMSRHPFDNDPGVTRLLLLLADRDPENYVYAKCAATCIPFINAEARERLFESADRHPDSGVRLEAACALARTGSEFGRHRLAQLCLNPRIAYDAIEYLKKLGLGAHIPKKARDPDFRAMAEMCKWLADPMEFNRPPDEINLYDTRELNWPPAEDRRRLWLFKFRYEPSGDDKEHEGIGMVGSTTFALAPVPTADLVPEDVYGLHCCFELRMNEAHGAPEVNSAAVGRKILARSNPGFGDA